MTSISLYEVTSKVPRSNIRFSDRPATASKVEAEVVQLPSSISIKLSSLAY